jgi:transcriptional regulator with PAS, ATPase and Fis domain
VLLQDIATLLLHAGHPELIATHLVRILEACQCLVSAAAVVKAADGTRRLLASFDSPESANLPAGEVRTLVIAPGPRTVEIRMTPRADLESSAAVSAVTMLLRTVSALEQAHIEQENQLTLWPPEETGGAPAQTVIKGRMADVMSLGRRVARTSVGVLLTGESGTGKEILARAIHAHSARADKSFVPFNCAAVPRDMLESQLFGHRRGAFTGAERDSPGVIRAARGGTLFLDEIGELSLDLQPKLLRFLESGEISPLGEPAPMTVDVRIVAATNTNLEELVRQGRFREDLFYRLNVFRITIPPLRERRDEIPALVQFFLDRAAQEFGKGRLRVAHETMEHLLLYAWPGNVRQLNNTLRRMAALAEADSVLMPSALPGEIPGGAPRPVVSRSGSELAVPLADRLIPTLSRIEREMIKAALHTNNGKINAAAKALGISRKGLYLKRRRLGL